MQKEIIKYLQEKGYIINESAFKIINLANDWYCNNIISESHNRSTVQGEKYVLLPLGMGKRVRADEANLCEYVEINTDKAILDILNKNRFDVMYRELLELTPALGTTGAYISLKDADVMSDGSIQNGTIKLNYVNANGIIPLIVVNKEIIECACVGKSVSKGKEYTNLVIFSTTDKGYIS